MNTLHDAVRLGYSRSGGLYEKGRPDYRPEVVEKLIDHLKLTSESTVLDLAAGTGKFTRHLANSFDKLRAVEPVSEMREEFRRLLPQVPIIDGAAEKLPFESDAFDCVFVATAFHWFNTEKAAAEIYRVLKPGGGLGLIWNTWKKEEAPLWLAELQSILAPYGQGVVRYVEGQWRKAFEATGLFTPLQYEAIDYPFAATAETVIARMTSISYISALADEEFQKVESQLREKLARNSSEATDGKFILPLQDDLFWCFKR